MFETNSEDGGEEVSLHFDTGADYSLFCDEFLENAGIQKHNRTTHGEVMLHGQYHLAESVELDAVVVNPDDGRNRGVRYNVRVDALSIDRWKDSELMIECSSQCTRYREGDTRCAFRYRGLLGRTLYSKSDFDVVISAQTSRISFVKWE